MKSCDWIKCADEMPPEGVRVMLSVEYGKWDFDFMLGCLDRAGWSLDKPIDGFRSVTHWAWIPSPPSDY